MKLFNSFKKLLVASTVIASTNTMAQDTAAIIKEYNKVMAFAVQPHLYYSTIAKTEASPVLQTQDTATLTTEFYKNGSNVYSNNTRETTFIEDSLIIEVNHERKSIWINKLNAAGKEKINNLPLDKKELQQMFRKKFLISKTERGDSVQLNFVSRPTGSLHPEMSITLSYLKGKMIPEIMESTITSRQQIDDETINQLQAKGVNITGALVTIGNDKFLLRTQKMVLRFNDIDYSPARAMQLASWKSVLDYDQSTHNFKGKGIYADYEVTKNF